MTLVQRPIIIFSYIFGRRINTFVCLLVEHVCGVVVFNYILVLSRFGKGQRSGQDDRQRCRSSLRGARARRHTHALTHNSRHLNHRRHSPEKPDPRTTNSTTRNCRSKSSNLLQFHEPTLCLHKVFQNRRHSGARGVLEEGPVYIRAINSARVCRRCELNSSSIVRKNIIYIR